MATTHREMRGWCKACKDLTVNPDKGRCVCCLRTIERDERGNSCLRYRDGLAPISWAFVTVADDRCEVGEPRYHADRERERTGSLPELRRKELDRRTIQLPGPA